ncbi:MAG: YARHG domain-containing protein [Rhizobiaceae bacterium]
MSKYLFSATVALSLISSLAPANAASCFDLWYERNQIYDDAGMCFKSQLGQETFDNSDCYTERPKLTRAEQSRIFEIKAVEDAKRCKVNE